MYSGLQKLFSGAYVLSLMFSFAIVTYAGTDSPVPAAGQICLTDTNGQRNCFAREEVQTEFSRVREDASDPANVCLDITHGGNVHCYLYTDVRTALAPSPSASASSGPSAAPTASVERGGGQSGPVDTPAFRNIDPNSSFIGTFTGPDTAPLQGAYTAPLLQVQDRQIAFQILVNFFLGVIGVVAVLYLVTNGYRYVMARGDEGQMTQAKKGITFAIIGLLFVLAAYTIVATILNFGARPPATGVGVGVGIGVTF